MANMEHHRRPRRLAYLIVGAAAAIPVAILAANSGANASTSSSSSNAPGNATITANQGTPGTTPWPVAGTVDVRNFPSSTNVSGTVAATQSGPWTVTVTPPPPYSDACSDTSNECHASATTAPVVIKDASIRLQVPTGTVVLSCAVDPGNETHSVFIPMTEQGTTSGKDFYVGNSQLDMAVPDGSAPTAYCLDGSAIDATFDGEASSS
jgi:hypothetical protein